MSHNKLRTDKNCLNCGNVVEDRYCTHCGQENLEIQDSAIHLIVHYVQDLFHYDGKVWHTLKNLILKPGLVASEYMEGKRMRNLEPVRFYVFSSSVFFILLFLVVNEEKWNTPKDPEHNYGKRIYHLNQEKKFRKGEPDTAYIDLLKAPLIAKRDSLENTSSSENKLELDLSTPEVRDTQNMGWLEKVIDERAEARRKKMESKHEGDEQGAANEYVSEVFHKFPLLFFLSMPFFALFLKLLYFKFSRKRYVEHFIFSVYHYAFLFMITGLFLILRLGIDKIDTKPPFVLENVLTSLFILYLAVYLWFSMARFYQDRWFMRLLKYVSLMTLLFFTMLILLLIILFVTYLS